MKQKISKVASSPNNFRRNNYYYVNARTAWEEILLHFSNSVSNLKVLIPSYIGYSVNEGSGIFDPIAKHKIAFEFYSLNETLEIDIKDLKEKINVSKENTLVLLVHYFGFIDKNYKLICDWLDSNSIAYVEDCAHSMLTDVIGGSCGRRGQHAFYSIHKLMPFKDGGMLINNGATKDFKPHLNTASSVDPFQYDLKSIFDRRRSNFNRLVTLLIKVDGIELLKTSLQTGECPQTLPVLIKNVNRDTIYFEMNKKGYGMVSLYHTMIDELKDKNYPSSIITSKNLINFPVHQDISETDLNSMVDAFKSLLIELQ